MAWPKKEINWELLETYIKAGCTQKRIALSLNLDECTLRDRVREKYGIEWSAFSATLQSEGEMAIEAKQHEKAMKGYWPALQWLGKVRLGQKEQETVQFLAANQKQIDQDQKIMELEHKIAQLLEANGNKPQAE